MSQGIELLVVSSSNRIYVVNIPGGFQSFVVYSPGNTMTDIAVDNEGQIWGLGFGEIFTVNRETGARGSVMELPGFQFNSLEIADDGTFYIGGGTSLIEYSPDTGEFTDLATVSSRFSGDIVEVDGRIYGSLDTASQDTLIEYDPDSRQTIEVGALPASSVFGLGKTIDNEIVAFDSDDVYILDQNTLTVLFERDFDFGTANGADGVGFSVREESNASDVFRFFNKETGGHFFTFSTQERNNVLQNTNYQYEGAGFFAFDASVADQDGSGGASEVYRFYNTEIGGHFFTISEEEKNFVIDNLPLYRYEGAGFSAFEAETVEGVVPVYRFYNTMTGGHFFTISPEERETVIENLPIYRDEGVGFYALMEAPA